MGSMTSKHQQCKRRKRFEFTVGLSERDRIIQQKLDSLTGAGRARFIRDALWVAIENEQRVLKTPPPADDLAELVEKVARLARQIKKIGSGGGPTAAQTGGAPILQEVEPDSPHSRVAAKLLGLNFEQAFAEANKKGAK
jgi:hypothetical protein